MNAPAGQESLGGEVKVMAAVAIAAILGVTALVFTSGGDEPQQEAHARKVEAAQKEAPKDAPVDEEARAGIKQALPALPPEVLAERQRVSNENDARDRAARDISIDNPPEFDVKEDEVVWWNQQLEQAQDRLERRKTAMADLPRQEALVETAANPEKSRELFEKRKARFEADYERTLAKVEAIEKKIAELGTQ
jgi:hypothetical protein